MTLVSCLSLSALQRELIGLTKLGNSAGSRVYVAESLFAFDLGSASLQARGKLIADLFNYLRTAS